MVHKTMQTPAISPTTDAADAYPMLANPRRLCQPNPALTQPTLPTVNSSRAGVTRRLWKVTALCVGCVSPHKTKPYNGLITMESNNTFQTVTLALDLGTTTGWALRPRDGNMAHGFVSFKTQRFEGGGMRFLRFKNWLSEIKSITGDIQAVYFEEVRRHVGVDAAHVYGGLMATLTTWCEHHRIPYQGVPVGTIKKHATGKGNAGKSDVIAAMRALGHPVTDDNEADALAILHWAIDTQEA